MELERLKFCIERFDNYYDSVNSKSAVFLGISTFLLGGIIAVYPQIIKCCDNILWIHILLLTILGLGLAVMIVLISASIPFNGNSRESLLYYGFISGMDENEFIEKSKQRKEKKEIDDLRRQVYQLSKGLSMKFQKLRIVGVLFSIQLLILIPLAIVILTNIK